MTVEQERQSTWRERLEDLLQSGDRRKIKNDYSVVELERIREEGLQWWKIKIKNHTSIARETEYILGEDGSLIMKVGLLVPDKVPGLKGSFRRLLKADYLESSVVSFEGEQLIEGRNFLLKTIEFAEQAERITHAGRNVA